MTFGATNVEGSDDIKYFVTALSCNSHIPAPVVKTLGFKALPRWLPT